MSEKEKKYSSFEILNGIVHHDRDVLEYVYQSNFKAVRSFVKSKYGNEEDAWDVFQDAIGVIYDKSSKQRIELTSSFQTFFIAICKHLWYNQLRQKQSEPYLSVAELDTLYHTDIEDLDELYRKNVMFRLFRKYFQLLKKDCQKILRMTSRDKSAEIIADKLQYLSSQAVYNKRTKCFRKLISWIEKDPEYENLNEK